jgi:hypothetical protein
MPGFWSARKGEGEDAGTRNGWTRDQSPLTPLRASHGAVQGAIQIRWIMIAVALLALWPALLRYNRPLAVLIGGTAVGALVERKRGAAGWSAL